MSKRRAPAASSTAAQAFASSTTIVSAFTRNAGVSTISYISEPLDLSVISDSTVVVLFKNLSKQHENTKAKALEELQGIIEGLKSELEDGVLSAWVGSATLPVRHGKQSRD